LPQGVLCFIPSMFLPFPCSSARLSCCVLQPSDLFRQNFLFRVNRVSKCLARRVFRQLSLNLCLDPCIPVVYVSFKEDSVNSLGEIRWRGPCRVGQSGEVQVGELGPDLIMVEFLVGYGVRLGGLGWEMVIPCNHVIKCRLAPLSLPSVPLLYVGVPSSTSEKVFGFVICHSYILIKVLCVVPLATRMCTIQVSLHDYAGFLLLGYPVFCRIPHFSLPHRVGGCELVDIHELKGGPCWCPCLSYGETAI